MKIFGGILPSGSEMSRFVDEHPIVSIAGALAVFSAGNTLFKALTSPRGESPYALGYGTSSGGDDSQFMIPMGHLTKAQKQKVADIRKELKAASKMHSGQADRLKQLGNPPKGMQFFAHLSKSQTEELEKIQSELKAASRMHSGQADRLKQLGGFGASTSTTTSTSASHAMMPKEAAPTLLETQGASSGMFGRMRATPPSLRRRIAQSVGLGSAPTLFSGKQEISAKREEINLSGSVANMYAMDGFVPETADDMMVM